MDSSRRTALGIAFLVLITLLVVLLVGSMGCMGPGMMGRMMDPQVAAPTAAAPPAASPSGAEVGWPTAAWVLVVLLFVAVVVLTWLALARSKSTGKEAGGRESPLEIAKRRYVSGEISLPEYEEILHALTEAGEPLDAQPQDRRTRATRA